MSAKPRKPKVVDSVEPPQDVTILATPTRAPVEVPPSRGIPECPTADPALGMKTPAVVAWWFKYFPEDAAERYAGLTLD